MEWEVKRVGKRKRRAGGKNEKKQVQNGKGREGGSGMKIRFKCRWRTKNRYGYKNKIKKFSFLCIIDAFVYFVNKKHTQKVSS